MDSGARCRAGSPRNATNASPRVVAGAASTRRCGCGAGRCRRPGRSGPVRTWSGTRAWQVGTRPAWSWAIRSRPGPGSPQRAAAGTRPRPRPGARCSRTVRVAQLPGPKPEPARPVRLAFTTRRQPAEKHVQRLTMTRPGPGSVTGTTARRSASTSTPAKQPTPRAGVRSRGVPGLGRQPAAVDRSPSPRRHRRRRARAALGLGPAINRETAAGTPASRDGAELRTDRSELVQPTLDQVEREAYVLDIEQFKHRPPTASASEPLVHKGFGIRVGPRAAVRAEQPPREERGAETDHDRDHQELEHAATLTRE